jgi:hypothetical protein
MKRALRNTESAMFIKADGGETKSFQTARLFLSYDEAVAFSRTHKLAPVELVVHGEDQAEFIVPVPMESTIQEEEDATVGFDVQCNGEVRAEKDEPEPEAFLDQGANTADIAITIEVEETDRELQGYRENDCAQGIGVELDEYETAISEYARFEKAAEAPEFHFSPATECDLCGTALGGRWFFVDGRVRESGEWRDMCSRCFFAKGGKIGPGKGLLYQRQRDERWLLVGGFRE